MSPPNTDRSRARRWVRRVFAAAGLTIAGLLAARTLLFHGPCQPPAALPQAPIVDFHCHAAGIGAGNSGCHISPALRSNFRFHAYLQAFGVTEKELEQEGDSLLLDRLSARIAQSRHLGAAVVLAMDGVVDEKGELDLVRTEVYVPNDFIAEGARRHTNLIFGASINPYRRDALERLDDCARRGAVLVKWIPSIMAIDPADPRLIPFYQRLRQHQLVLLTHTGGERSFTHAHDELADPARLRLPLEQGVVVIAAHAAAGSNRPDAPVFDVLRRMMKEFPNLYADISALTQVNRLGKLDEVLKAAECRGRLVYGSDFPLINTALVSPWYFPLHLTLSQCWGIAAQENAWDRDIELKRALGVSADIFARGEDLVRRSAYLPTQRTR